MKKVMKKIIVFPAYLFYTVIMEGILGAGVPDLWDKMDKWR